MSRKPLIAGNWKMNLNHFEAIALVQKIAFSLPDKYFDKVDVTVLPPFTDLRSVQTLVDGDKLRLTPRGTECRRPSLGADSVGPGDGNGSSRLPESSSVHCNRTITLSSHLIFADFFCGICKKIVC